MLLEKTFLEAVRKCYGTSWTSAVLPTQLSRRRWVPGSFPVAPPPTVVKFLSVVPLPWESSKIPPSFRSPDLEPRAYDYKNSIYKSLCEQDQEHKSVHVHLCRCDS
jgi:hypothetical protein